MMRILIGYNGSDAATAALLDLRRAGFPDDTEALILSVAEFWQPPQSSAEAEATANAGKNILCREFPTWTVRAETATGSPPREILARSESFKPDVIVVGERPHMHGAGDIFMGQTSQTILTEAGCSVRIARGSDSEKPRAARLLVGFDGSAGSLHSVEAITARKWPAGSMVKLLAIADSSVLNSIGRFTPQMKDASVEARLASQWAETLAGGSLEELKKAGLTASVEVRFGHPKDMIIEEADHWKTDTIFVGPHCAPNSFERYLIGSVSSGVAARANCTVEAVRKWVR